MKKNILFIIIIVIAVVFVVGVLYAIDLVDTTNDDTILVKNSNTNTLLYSELLLDGTNLILEIPDPYALCVVESDEFFPGIKAYAWADGTCDHIHDAPDINVFVFNEDLDISDEQFLKIQADVFFESADDVEFMKKDDYTYVLLNGTFVGVKTNRSDGYRLYIQANAGGSSERDVEEVSHNILQTVKYINQ